MMRVVCFDLDDTLYKEIDFLKSAYHEIANYAAGQSGGDRANEAYLRMLDAYADGGNAFEALNAFLETEAPISEYLSVYRHHKPNISLSEDVARVLAELREAGLALGLITDGRSVQQRNKIAALGLYDYFENDNIVISQEFGSEKPCLANYSYFMEKYPDCKDFIYVGDNPRKDFLAPNQLGWETVCLLDDGRNVHKQNLEDVEKPYAPSIVVKSLNMLYSLAVRS